jgi:catechol 2,3-dioxygenase-like lactoylglutathione lyase family enzyme
MKIGHIELFVTNPIASKEFYVEKLGFELLTVQQEQFVWLKLGDAEILLRPGVSYPAPPIYSGGRSGIVLYTDDLLGTVEIFRQRGVVFGVPDGADRCYTFMDPDGHWFQLVDPADHT